MRQSVNNPHVRYQQSQQELSQEQDDYLYKKKTSKQVSGNFSQPRFIKNQIDQGQVTEVVINVSRTNYDVIEQVGQQMGWTVDYSRKSHKWDVMWVDGAIQAHDLFKLNKHQKISHFPAISVLSRKDFLGRGLDKLRKVFPQEYDFFPLTWALPADYNDLIVYNATSIKQNKKEFFIFKPQASCQGKGIKITDKVQDFKDKTGIAQIYVNDPYLIQGLKFDLRIYVLLAGCDPLRIFIYEQGLGRFATELYKKVKKKNMKQSCMHLTNYAINKLNKKFIFNTSEKHMNQGHKRSLTSVYEYLQKNGCDVAKIKSSINDLIVKTIIIGQPMLSHIYSLSQPDNYANDMCFQILGFDVLLDQRLKPILLQVNHTPSFATDTPLDKFIKKNLIKDTINLLNVNIETKKRKIESKQQFIQLRSQNKKVKLASNQIKQLKKKANEQRDEYEKNNHGKFQKLYPIVIPQKQQAKQIIQHAKNTSRKYQQMIKVSKNIFEQHYGFKRKGKSITHNQNLASSLRPYSLSKNIKKNQSQNGQNLPPNSMKNNRMDIVFDQQSPNSIRKVKNASLKNSYQKFPLIQKQKMTLKIPYVCPIISQINRIPMPKFKSNQQFLNFHDQAKRSKQRQIKFSKGNFLAPKTWKLEDIESGSMHAKQKITKIQQNLIQNSNSILAKLVPRKKN